MFDSLEQTFPHIHIEHFMQRAIQLARNSIGKTAPNPGVGCVVVKNNRVIAEAATAAGGRPHAEKIALEQAGAAARGATMYVTLEPCAHYGKTPPCTGQIINSGVKKVIIGCQDPDPRVNGKGIKQLKEAGIEVELEVCAQEAAANLQGFFFRIQHERPFVTLKIAMSMDGKIATWNRHSKWLTSEKLRERGHELRAYNDAILIGIGTVLADDPLLTCRHPQLSNSTLRRIVLDTNARLPQTSQITGTAEFIPTYLFTCSDETEELEAMGVKVLRVPLSGMRVDLYTVMRELAKLGVNNLLVEGGSRLNTSLIQAGLVDKIMCFKSNKIIGNDGIPAIGDLGISQVDEAYEFPTTIVSE